jgi:hypothetical protein
MPIVDAADAADWPLPLTPMPPATAHATEQRRADRANAREASCPPPTHILYQDRSVLAVHKPVGRYCEVRAAAGGQERDHPTGTRGVRGGAYIPSHPPSTILLPPWRASGLAASKP